MLDQIQIRKIDIDDLPKISMLAKVIWPSAFDGILSEQQIEYMLDLFYSQAALIEQVTVRHHNFYIAFLNDIEVGFISLESNHLGKQKTKVHKIYLLPNTQGKGIGKMLMFHAEKIALDMGDIALTLNVNRFNKARYFYESLGFVVTKEENISIGNDFMMEDYVMEKNI